MALVNQKTDLKRLKYADFSTSVGPAVQVSIGTTIKGDTPSYNRFSKPILARKDDLLRMSRLLTYNGAANRDIKDEIAALDNDIQSIRRDTSLTSAQRDAEILRIRDRQSNLKNVTNGLKPAAQNFLANQAIIATVKSINAVQKARRDAGEDGVSFKQVAGAIGSEIATTAGDAAKVVGGLLAQTPVAGTGTHFIYAPAVGTQYLRKSPGSGGLGNFLRNIAQNTGTAGGPDFDNSTAGVDGAQLAYAGASIIADSTPQNNNQYKRTVSFSDYTAGRSVDESNSSISSNFETSSLRARLEELRESTNYQKGKTENGTRGQLFRGEYLNFFGETALQPPRVEKPDGTVQYLNGFEEEDKVNTPENILNKNRTSRLNLNAREQEKSKLDVDGKFNKEFGKITEEKRNKPIYVKAKRNAISRGIINPDGVSSNPDLPSYSSDLINLHGGTGENIDNTFLTRPLPDQISDIIPFEFQVLDPKFPNNPRYVYFRAYLDSFTDNYTGNWNGTKYLGRAEEVYNYTGFDREISFDFKIAAMTSQELTPLYRKLNYFAGVTAPSYDTNGSFMRGVHTKISIGDYLQAVPGFFSSINLSWDTNYPWEIGFDADGEENDVPRNPTILNVSTTFKPIHNFNPELGQSFIGAGRSINA